MFDGHGIIYNDEAKMEPDFNYKDFDNLMESWEKYDGDFKNDTKDGQGKLYLVDGSWFEGTFVEDRVHGKGLFHLPDNETVIEGQWEDNKLVYENEYDENAEHIA